MQEDGMHSLRLQLLISAIIIIIIIIITMKIINIWIKLQLSTNEDETTQPLAFNVIIVIDCLTVQTSLSKCHSSSIIIAYIALSAT